MADDPMMTAVQDSMRSWRTVSTELADVLGECTFSDPALAMRALNVLCTFRAMTEVE